MQSHWSCTALCVCLIRAGRHWKEVLRFITSRAPRASARLENEPWECKSKQYEDLISKTLLECHDYISVWTQNGRNATSGCHCAEKPNLTEASLGLRGWILPLRPPVETFWTWETTKGEEKRKYWFGRDSSECVGLEDFHITPTSQTYTFQRMLHPPPLQQSPSGTNTTITGVIFTWEEQEEGSEGERENEKHGRRRESQGIKHVSTRCVTIGFVNIWPQLDCISVHFQF